MKMKKTLFFWIAGLALIGASCTAPQDIQVERETVDLAFPIFTSETTLSDLIESGQDSAGLVVFADNSMGFVYETMTSVDIPMPVLKDFELPLLSPETNITTEALDNVMLANAKFDEGTLKVYFENNTIAENINVVVTFPNIMKDGIPAKAAFVLAYDGSFPSRMEWETDLAGYDMTTIHDEFSIIYDAKLANGTNATITTAKMGITDAALGYIDGDWAKTSIPVSLGTHQINFFDHYSDGSVVFTNPSLKIFVNNPVGVPSKLEMNNISIHTNTNQIIDLQGHYMTNGMSLDYPTMIQVGDSKSSNFTIDKNNSSIVEAAGEQPTHINYDLNYILAPDGSNKGFMTKDSKIDLTVQAQLPFEGKVNDFKAVKSFDVKFTNEFIQSAAIKLQAVNQIPLSTRIQLYFIDNADIILDSLDASNGILAIDAAEVDHLGDAVQSTNWEKEIPISPEQWERIKKAVKVELATSFTSSESGQVSVKIKANQRVELNAGLKIVVLP